MTFYKKIFFANLTLEIFAMFHPQTTEMMEGYIGHIGCRDSCSDGGLYGSMIMFVIF